MSSEMHGMFPTAMEFLGYQSKNSLADNATDTDIATANLGSWRGFGAAAAEEQRSNSACWPPSGIAVSGLSSIPSSHNFQSLAAASRKEFHAGRSAENRKLGVSMDMAEIIQQGSDGSNKQQHEQAYLVNTSGSSNNSRYHHQQQQHGYSFFDASSSTTAANVLAAAHHSVLGLNLPSLEHHQHHHQQQLLPFSIPVSSSTRWQQQQQQQSNQADLGVVSNLSSVYSQQYSNGVAAVNNWMSSSTRGPLDASASAGGGGGTSSQRLALSLSSSSSYSYRPPHPPEVQMISPGGGGGGNLFQMGGESSRSVTASGRNSDGPVFMGLDSLTAAVSHQPSRESAAAIIRGEGAARSLFSGYGNCLRNSIYFKPAQELLLEFCNVGCSGEAKLDKDTASNKKKGTVVDYSAAAAASGKTDEEFKSKKSGFNDDTPGPFAGDTYELQKRKAKLLSMLEEVDMRYKNYCSQLQMVVAAMEAVTAPGCAKPYTRLAVKAMSRHFRCLRDAITGQLQATARLLGENQVTLPGNTTRGETPRLGLIERAMRQHQHQHNNQNSPRLLDPHPWRPQRGLPERSVFILRSWLFEHFLHPYPTDGDKHILAKQTGLTRSQVSNWFINARVRLWKPMVEEMYMEELNEEKMEKEEVKDDAAGAGAGAGAGAAETDADKNPATTMNQATATGAADTVSYLQQQRFPSGNGSGSSFKVVAPAATETADSETTTSSSRREMATTPTTTQTQTQIQITMDEGPHPYKRLLQQQQLAQTPGLQSACNVQDFVAYPAENLNLRYGSNNSTKKSSGAADTLGSNQNINNGVSLTLGLRHSGLPYHLSEPTAKYSAAAAAGSGIYMAPRPTTATAAANSSQHHDAHFLEDSTANNNGSSGGGLIHQDLQQQYRHYTNGPRLLHDFVQG